MLLRSQALEYYFCLFFLLVGLESLELLLFFVGLECLSFWWFWGFMFLFWLSGFRVLGFRV